MTTKTSAQRRRLPSLFLGAALALGASGAGAFPFFQATNSDTTTVEGEPESALALNFIFDPAVLFISFIDVAVVMSPGSTDENGNGLFDPEDVEFIDFSGTVDFLFGDVDDDTGVFTPDGDAGSGVISLSMTNVQYDGTTNAFFVNGPAYLPEAEAGDASGNIELTSVVGDLASTPGFIEPDQCLNVVSGPAGDLGESTLPDADCFIPLGLSPDNDESMIVSFVLDEPIVGPLPGLVCEGGSCTITTPPVIIPFAVSLPAAPTGQLVGIFDHAGVDMVENPDCDGFWNNPLSCVANPTRYRAFTPSLYGVPAPTTLALLGLGLTLIVGARRRLA